MYIFLNLAANGIMDAKIAGEDAVRKLYAAPGLAEKHRISVVRPGGLLRDPGMGVSAVELNQGDTKSGRINRADVAAICIESLDSKAAFDTTFECYYADTAKGLDDVMKSNAAAVGAGVKTTPTETSTGRERRGHVTRFEGSAGPGCVTHTDGARVQTRGTSSRSGSGSGPTPTRGDAYTPGSSQESAKPENARGPPSPRADNSRRSSDVCLRQSGGTSACLSALFSAEVANFPPAPSLVLRLLGPPH